MNSQDVDAALNADPNNWREPWRKHVRALQEYVQELRAYIAELSQKPQSTQISQRHPTSEELREAMEVMNELAGGWDAAAIVVAAVLELYEALESAEGIVQFDRGLSDEPEILNRYRAAIEGGDDGI